MSGGGSAIDTTISSGGSQYVGGVAIGTTIYSGGWQDVGGSASDTTISSGGALRVNNHCVATGIKQEIGGIIILIVNDRNNLACFSPESFFDL